MMSKTVSISEEGWNQREEGDGALRRGVVSPGMEGKPGKSTVNSGEATMHVRLDESCAGRYGGLLCMA